MAAANKHRQLHGLLVALNLLFVLLLLNLLGGIIAHLQRAVVATAEQAKCLCLVDINAPDLALVLLRCEYARLFHKVPDLECAVEGDRQQLLAKVDPQDARNLLGVAF